MMGFAASVFVILIAWSWLFYALGQQSREVDLAAARSALRSAQEALLQGSLTVDVPNFVDQGADAEVTWLSVGDDGKYTKRDEG